MTYMENSLRLMLAAPQLLEFARHQETCPIYGHVDYTCADCDRLRKKALMAALGELPMVDGRLEV